MQRHKKLQSSTPKRVTRSTQSSKSSSFPTASPIMPVFKSSPAYTPISKNNPAYKNSFPEIPQSKDKCYRNFLLLSDSESDSEDSSPDYPETGKDKVPPLVWEILAEDIESLCGIDKIIENSSSKSFLTSILNKRPDLYGEPKSRRREQIRKGVGH